MDVEGATSDENMIEVSYNDLIPNNVGLNSDRALKRALERWQPKFLDWWRTMGPDGFQEAEVYLRTAVGVGKGGWAVFDYVKMPEYRWGILLAPKEEGRTIPFGKHKGEPVWEEVPGEYRALLRRLIVVQGDTEPASVEQQRYLGKTCPSLYDLRNLFQVNVEEGRHLWAMVHLLQKYFGRDGREEADALLERRSGDRDKPRLLGAFNEETPDWLSFFMFTFFTDRDGKMQLESLAQSGFDPLARTTRFMLTEEAFHMFVGESGVGRAIQRTCEVMNEAGIKNPYDVEAVRKLGVIDLPLIQRKANFHIALTRDLFGSEISTNAATYFNAGLKGRYKETRIDDDHQLKDATYPVLRHFNGEFFTEKVPALSAVNARLLDDYSRECQGGLDRWNKIIKNFDIEFTIKQPHVAFNRNVGEFANLHVSTEGGVFDEPTWTAHREEWLPKSEDLKYLHDLMKQEKKCDCFANWISPPRHGVNNMEGDFEYVKLR
ncbi:MAG: benzoyl-CoA 2,3-epoxidase subunit BoxB [Rhodospirillaceae bacterium TMED8]|nr:MAG: benzoyl-CoA 2,3-epoxidase subunit BoxB [Rhodospirillaceae bacterium TMED8]